jgi:hypothetical protein
MIIITVVNTHIYPKQILKTKGGIITLFKLFRHLKAKSKVKVKAKEDIISALNCGNCLKVE